MYKVKFAHINLIANDAHIAFSVEDVEQILKNVLNEGGKQVGKIVSKEISNAGKITFVYCTDPDGNILELQKWH